jgi:dienelactone hydrolase
VYPVCWPQSAILQGKNTGLNASVYQAMTGSPVHILAGARDDFDDDPDACPKFIQALPASVRSYVTVTVYPDVGHGFDVPKSEERTFEDPVAHMGHGGMVRFYGDAATADKARAFAVEFFKSNLAAK